MLGLERGTTQNNLVRDHGSESDILFTDYANYDLTISSLSSPVYTGATDVSSYAGKLDYDGYPLNASGFAQGAYSGYNKKTITPSAGDPDAATFTDAVAVIDLTQLGGTITFEADKQGVLYWTVVTDDATPPTISEIVAGSGIVSGTILDAGTAASADITGLTQGTAYDLYALFVTVDGIYQASATKVDFTTTSDTVAPTIASFVINDANKDRIYFTSSEVITATTFAGFTVATPTKTISSITINAGQTTGHYFTVSVPFTYGNAPTIAYSGSGSNLQDASANSLASFSAANITNNIAAGVEENVVFVDIVNATATGNNITATGSGNARSSQIIPAASNGYVTWDWDQDTRDGTYNTVIGIIPASDSRTKANTFMWIALETGNLNITTWEGTAFRVSSGYKQVDPPTNNTVRYRVRLDRTAGFAYAETSINGAAYVQIDESNAALPASDFRFVFITPTSGKKCVNAKIQADLGLN